MVAIPDLGNTQECRSHALFMYALADAWPILLFILLHCVAASLTGFILKVTPREPSTQITVSTTSDVESTAIPTAAVSGHGGEEVTSDEPPPYPAPFENPPPAPEPAVPTASKTKRSSAHEFVVGTSLFVALITVLFILALDIESLIYCMGPSVTGTSGKVVLWGSYSLQCLWCSMGATCWAMLLRNLWGPQMKKKYPFTAEALLLAVFVVPATPIFMLGMGCIKMIECCQGIFCGSALEEEREELGQSLELQEGVTLGTQLGAEDSECREEERVGLMNAIKGDAPSE